VYQAALAQCTSHAPLAGVAYLTGEIRQGRPAVVLLHGIGSSAASWCEVIVALSKEYNVYAWDAPGYGESTPVDGESPMPEQYVARLLAWLKALNLSQVYLVGHSLGALMATAFARQHADWLHGLCLLSPAKGYGADPPLERKEKLAVRLARLHTLGPVGMAKARASAMLSPNASAEALAWITEQNSRVDPKGYAQASHLLANGDLLLDASLYHGEVWVGVGAADTITPPRQTQTIANHFQTAVYEVFPGLGHACYVENAKICTAFITHFLKRSLS
jgi:pimeloyl-ACP methyl ester carboxylesterase